MRFKYHLVTVALSCAMWTLGLSRVCGAESKTIQFNRDIRPIMSDTCFRCHGFDAKARKGGLRLDVREEALRPAKSGAVPIVPGNAEKSEVVRRIFTHDVEDQMPPAEVHKELTSQQKELFRRWINEGAVYQGHWAFEPTTRPETIPPSNRRWTVRNPIDNFVAVRLEKERLKPSTEADKATLIRRVSLDLTGLPPTLMEVEAFLADVSPGAYEALVDKLLASPRYGERMAMQWLDYARYADSHGFQTDSSRSMWPWRDWVIRAFNDNLPFDQFTIEQLAGDLLHSPTRDQVIATGFHRNHRINGEGGIISEEWRVENIVDRVETTGLTWLALTLNGCRCHDHKYDPIKQKEFYELFAFFNNVDESGTLEGIKANRGGSNPEPTVLVPNLEQEARLVLLQSVAEGAAKRVADLEEQLPARLAEWEPGFITRMKEVSALKAWELLLPDEVKSKGGASFTKRDDGAYLAGGTNPEKDSYFIRTPLSPGSLSGLLLEVFPDPSLPTQSLGRNDNGNFVLSKVEAEVQVPGEDKVVKIRFARVHADFSQEGYPVEALLDPKKGTGWAIAGNMEANRVSRKAMFLIDPPLAVAAGATLTVRLKHEALSRHNIGCFRLSRTGLPPALVKLDGAGVSDSLKRTLEIAADQRDVKQRDELAKFFRNTFDGPLKEADPLHSEAKKAADAFESSIPTTMVMRELDKPREAYVLERGEYDKRGERVFAGLPSVFPPIPAGAPTNRLGLAKWIMAPSNPLTARVWVNRQWERFFGTGLVKTVENFGSQSDPPSHPDLIDWLATEFVRLGWDMKAMQKLIVMSATYRQSSIVTPDLQSRDPENRLLARGPRFRLPGELIRDQALAVSGMLAEKLGGPSVRPYMPEGVWDETSVYGDLRGYKRDSGDGLYRRTLYTVWKRTAAPPTMTMFDAPTREICTVKRSRTDTPLQALALMNEVTFVEAARALAQRMMHEGGKTSQERVAYGFRLVTARSPDSSELKVLLKGLHSRLSRFRSEPAEATKFLEMGDSKRDLSLDPAELAAYGVTANVLLNLDETTTRE